MVAVLYPLPGIWDRLICVGSDRNGASVGTRGSANARLAGDHRLFGWRVQSALPLPELLPWQGDARAPDVVIELGAVPPVDPRLPCLVPGLEIRPDGVRLAIPAVAEYWVEAGRRVIVQPILPQDTAQIRLFLLGTVLAILCFQRGLLPMHASAVDIGGRALLVSGASGAGKSTLAAALSARGYRLLSDDVCALALPEGQPLAVLPAFPRVKLAPDSADRLQIPTEGLERIRGGTGKGPSHAGDGAVPACRAAACRNPVSAQRRRAGA